MRLPVSYNDDLSLLGQRVRPSLSRTLPGIGERYHLYGRAGDNDSSGGGHTGGGEGRGGALSVLAQHRHRRYSVNREPSHKAYSVNRGTSQFRDSVNTELNQRGYGVNTELNQRGYGVNTELNQRGYGVNRGTTQRGYGVNSGQSQKEYRHIGPNQKGQQAIEQSHLGHRVIGNSQIGQQAIIQRDIGQHIGHSRKEQSQKGHSQIGHSQIGHSQIEHTQKGASRAGQPNQRNINLAPPSTAAYPRTTANKTNTRPKPTYSLKITNVDQISVPAGRQLLEITEANTVRELAGLLHRPQPLAGRTNQLRPPKPSPVLSKTKTAPTTTSKSLRLARDTGVQLYERCFRGHCDALRGAGAAT